MSLVVATVGGAHAYADGAFPNSLAVLLPADRPREIILATTFGLVIAEDDGATWLYACETDASRNGRQYSLGAAPADRLYAIADPGAVVSSDGGCSWTTAGGALEGAVVTDLFPDPIDPARVLAVAAIGGQAASVFASRDGGLTYDVPFFAPPTSATVTGVEIAASAPQTTYVVFYQRPGLQPKLARTDDYGTSWTTFDLGPSLGPVVPYLAAVDPVDPRKVFVRAIGTTADLMHPRDLLAVSEDGGASWTTPVTVVDGTLTAFLLRRDGTPGTILLAGTRSGSGSDAPIGFRSKDGGRTFVDWPISLHVRGLAERSATLFAAADFTLDGLALASSDDGVTFTPRLRFGQIGGLRACAQQSCRDDCLFQASLIEFPAELCGAAPTGSGGSGGAPSASRPSAGGCACALPRALTPDTHEHGAALLATAGTLAVILLAHRRRRAARPRRPVRLPAGQLIVTRRATLGAAPLSAKSK